MIFIGEKVVCVVYVDELLFWTSNEADIHALVLALREEVVDIEQYDDDSGLSGIKLVHNSKTVFLNATGWNH